MDFVIVFVIVFTEKGRFVGQFSSKTVRRGAFKMTIEWQQ